MTGCATDWIFDVGNRFRLLPDETIEPLTELFRHRFIEFLDRERLLSRKNADGLLSWY